ncbi:MAG: hypothetical protein AAB405_01970 [Patescibacteria group bacterium]
MSSIRNFIEKLQNSDDAVKKRWLVIMSGLSMIIVIAIWLVFLNNLMQRHGENSSGQSETTFWQVFKTGLQIAGNSIKEKSADLIYKIIGEKTIIIK